jgi:hypothetical protein
LDPPVTEYLQVRKGTTVREIKTLVCPQHDPHLIDLILHKKRLANDEDLTEGRLTLHIKMADFVKVKVFDPGRSDQQTQTIRLEASDRSAAALRNHLTRDRPDMFGQGRPFELRYQGESLAADAPVPIDGPPIQIKHLTMPYTFRLREQSVTEWCNCEDTFRQLRGRVTQIFKQNIQRRRFIFFILGGVPLDWNVKIGSVPAASTIDITAWRKEQYIYHEAHFDLISAQFGDLRKKFPDASEIFQCRGQAGDEQVVTLMNMDYLVAYPKFEVVPMAEEKEKFRSFLFRLPDGTQRFFDLDTQHTGSEVMEIIHDITRRLPSDFALRFRYHFLTESDSVFRIGYRDGDIIEVVDRMPGQGEVRLVIQKKRDKDHPARVVPPVTTIYPLREVGTGFRASVQARFGVGEIELVALGRLIDETRQVTDIGPIGGQTIYIYERSAFPYGAMDHTLPLPP